MTLVRLFLYCAVLGFSYNRGSGMNDITIQSKLKRTGMMLYGIGIISLIIGAVSAVIAPLEFYCYYFFFEGGRFHYDGFGMGSFMFAFITFQIFAYYLIAVVFLGLGYGHLRMKRWIRIFSIILLKIWLVTGLPIIIAVILFISMTKALPFFYGILLFVLIASTYFILPFFMLRFYNSPLLDTVLESDDPAAKWLMRHPERIIFLVFLYICYACVLHIPIFFRGIFPLFGIFVHGMKGMICMELSLVVLILLCFGTLQQKRWAWWSGIVFFLTWIVSIAVTFLNHSFMDILAVLKFPAREYEAVRNVPLQGYHMIIFLGLPLVLTLYLIYKSKPYFNK